MPRKSNIIDIKEELFRWYDKEHLWRWEQVLDFVLHILAKRGGKYG